MSKQTNSKHNGRWAATMTTTGVSIRSASPSKRPHTAAQSLQQSYRTARRMAECANFCHGLSRAEVTSGVTAVRLAEHNIELRNEVGRLREALRLARQRTAFEDGLDRFFKTDLGAASTLLGRLLNSWPGRVVVVRGA